MFVNTLDIKEFRGIKRCKKPIRFSNFTVIIGRNNSGKSSILEALSLLPTHSINDYLTKNSKRDTLVHLHDQPKRLLYQYAGSSELKYDLQNNIVEIKIGENTINTSFRGNTQPANSMIARYLNCEVSELDKLVVFFPDTSILGELEGRMRQVKETIVKKGFHIELAEFLNRCVNDKYSEIVFLDPISLRKIYHNNMVYIWLRDLGSGAEKVVKIMALLEVVDPRLVIIDDFESGLHPSLLKLFFIWFKSKKWQTIISTHSIDVLYHLTDIKPKDVTILQLNKSSEDILSHKSLNLGELEDIMNSNIDPRLLADNLDL